MAERRLAAVEEHEERATLGVFPEPFDHGGVKPVEPLGFEAFVNYVERPRSEMFDTRPPAR